MSGNQSSPAPSSRVLLATPRDNNNSKMSTGMPSSASMPQLSSSMADYSKGYSTPYKAPAAADAPSLASGQSSTSGGGNGKENMRTPMVSAIPTRLKQQQYVQSPNGSTEPSMQELLAQSPGIVHTRSAIHNPESSNTGMASWRKGQGFKQWEQELLRSPEVRRKADVAQLCKYHRVPYHCCGTDLTSRSPQTSWSTLLMRTPLPRLAKIFCFQLLF